MKRKETLEQLNKLRTQSDPKFRRELTVIADSLQGLLDEASSGGKKRAKNLSKKRRVEIARNAAQVRWARVKGVEFGSEKDETETVRSWQGK